MNTRRWPLYVAVALLVCFTSALSLRAQEQQPAAAEKLPEIIKRIQPSTVVVLIYDEEGTPIFQGSGFFVGQEGHIITNYHVLEGAGRAEIKTAQGKIHPITHIVAEDKEGDLVRASVDIPPGSAQPLKLSDSIPQVGHRIVVIGNPLGFEGTVSDGIVSVVRDIPAFGKIIQLSAPISPGSSGSPVVDMKGQVIGIATFVTFYAQHQNQGFAIPAQRVAKLKPGKPKALAEWQEPAVDERLAAAKSNYYRGVFHLSRTGYEQALSFFEKAVEKNPQYAEAWWSIGHCRGQLGRHTEEIAAYKQAIRIKPDYAEVHYNLGVAYSQLGRHTEAIAACKQAIRIWPDCAEAHSHLGFAYNQLGRHTEAIAACRQAIRIWPDYADAHCNLGVAYAKHGRYTEAIAACQQAIRINPDHGTAHYNLGVTYSQLGRHTEEIAAYKQAIRIKPDYAKPHYNLGVAYTKLRRYAEAIEAFKQAVRLEPGLAVAHHGLAVTYLLAGDRGSALEEYKILKDLDKDMATELFNLIYK